MSRWRPSVAVVGGAILLGAPCAAQVIPLQERTFNEQILRPSGQPVVPLFDGWYPNPDGTYGMCFGYFNLNTVEAVDVPLGPDNFIEPSAFHGMQPTHFDPVPAANYRRHFCVVSVRVPEDFGQGSVVWTLRTGGETLSTPGKLLPPYILDEPESGGRGVVAPFLSFDVDGPSFQGRTGFTAASRTAVVGDPITLSVWVDHPAPRSWVGWTQHQGPGKIEFGRPEMMVDRPGRDGRVPVDGRSSATVSRRAFATTTATFSVPGEYVVRVQSIYSTTSFEYHCCWTNGYIPVTVTR